jgi:hypothetical protein
MMLTDREYRMCVRLRHARQDWLAVAAAVVPRAAPSDLARAYDERRQHDAARRNARKLREMAAVPAACLVPAEPDWPQTLTASICGDPPRSRSGLAARAPDVTTPRDRLAGLIYPFVSK